MEIRQFFFEPVTFCDDLPQLAVEFVDFHLSVGFHRFSGYDKGLVNPLKSLFLPVRDLGCVYPVLRRNLIHRLLLPDGLQGHFTLEIGTVMLADVCQFTPSFYLKTRYEIRGVSY